MPPELEAKIDAWIKRQPDPKPSKSEAIRRLVEQALANETKVNKN
jgi:Arc/MetJ-type ribon-helix-helix transcriptional regulator